jgi:putative transposase
MARRARMTVPGIPHHVTQRGNRRERIFLEPGDKALYLDLMSAQLRRHGVACWAYCLMPSRVHLILTPADKPGLARAVGEAHRRYVAFVGARGRWTGHLFQARFASVAMDEDHLLVAFRYIVLNPVKAQLAPSAADWPWSSAAAHLAGHGTPYVDVEPALSRIDDFAFVADEANDEAQWSDLLRAEQVGRPVGAKAWIEDLEKQYGRTFSPPKRGPKPRLAPSADKSGDLFGN